MNKIPTKLNSKPFPLEPLVISDEMREKVKMMSALGITQPDIAKHIINPATGKGISPMTMIKYFRHELDIGMQEANFKVGASLFKNATDKMNVNAQIFWAKSRMGWKEPQDIKITTVQELWLEHLERTLPEPDPESKNDDE